MPKQLNVTISSDLMAELKSESALKKIELRNYVQEILKKRKLIFKEVS